MKLHSLIVLWPVCFFLVLTFTVLLVPSIIIPYWYNMIKHMERDVEFNSRNLHSELLSDVETTAQLLYPINSSATNLARVLNSSLKGTELSFSEVENKVAPIMFQALSIVPLLSQISYIGLDGLFFSYYNDHKQTFAVYSNSSFSYNSSTPTEKYSWYTQPVNRDTGKLYGEAIKSNPLITVNASWFQEALNSSNGYATIGNGWNNARDLLLLNTAGMDGKGAISLGVPVKALIDFFVSIDLHGGSLYLVTRDERVLVEGLPNTHMVLVDNTVYFQLVKPNGEQVGHIGNVSCMPNNGTLRASSLNIWGRKYVLYCSPLEILGVKSVYTLAFPYKGLIGLVQKNGKGALILLILMIFTMLISIFSFVFLIVRAAKREMHLCAALIKQMEATQQAERKSVNKSLAFASASHDIRASLAGITGLIEICYDEAAPASELETNLKQMDDCAKDLLGLLNSFLDTSKIEAGKMQLEEENFDLAQFLEDVVDLYHPVGMKKGVDVVLDPYDNSVIKFSHVKADRGKLKQILCNLLNNAVKFTSEGHISVRAWVEKPSLENSIIASSQNGFMRFLPCLFYKNSEAFNDLETMNTFQQNPNFMEFVFEVEDTGKGIPKEKQKSVFENYVQVKETAHGQGGTGLGLGIVQSLVRLMGGEIGIVDKEIGEKGTCFRFNVFLTLCHNVHIDNAKAEDIEMGDMHGDAHQSFELSVRTSSPGLTVFSPSPRLTIHSPSPKLEGSHVVLLIQNDERRRISKKFMESQGIKVSVVEKWEYLAHTLKRIKQKLNLSHNSFSGDLSSRSDCLSKSISRESSASSKDVPLSAIDGTVQIAPLYKRINLRGAPAFILLVIDANAGPFPDLCKIVAEFRRGLNSSCCKVVWLDKPTMRCINVRSLEEDKLDPSDDIICKPFHGSRLYQVIRFLPEFGGNLQGLSAVKTKKDSTFQVGKVSTDPSSSTNQSRISAKSKNSPILPLQRSDTQQEHGSSSSEKPRKKILSPTLDHTHVRSKSTNSAAQRRPIQESEIQQLGGPSIEKPLSGKKILVAEDNAVLRKLAMSNLLRLGATVELCENGEQALELVCNGLSDQRKHNASKILPFDYILMDCEMPIMNGYEATRQIRKEEKYYGVHIPIIALTAHISGEEANKTILAGMDVHLGKPLKREQLLEAIESINGKGDFI